MSPPSSAEAGGVVVAVTNDAASPLADAAAVTLSVSTSKELAVPATKTVTGQLALVTLLAEAVGDGVAEYTGGETAWAALAATVDTGARRRRPGWRSRWTCWCRASLRSTWHAV